MNRRFDETRPGSAAHLDSGSIAPLVVGYMGLLVALITLVIDITAVQLAMARLYDVADALALDASDAISLSAVYRDGLGPAVPLTDQTVRDAATRLLAGQQPPVNMSSWWLADGTGVGSSARDSPGGDGAVVALSGRIEVPVGSGMLETIGASVTLTVRARAQSLILQPPRLGTRTPLIGSSRVSSTDGSATSGK